MDRRVASVSLLLHLTLSLSTICLDAALRPITMPCETHNCVYRWSALEGLSTKPNREAAAATCRSSGSVCYGCCYKSKCQKLRRCSSILQKKHELTLVFFLVTSMGLGFFSFVIATAVQQARSERMLFELVQYETEATTEDAVKPQFSFAFLQEHASRLSLFETGPRIQQLNSIQSMNGKLG